MFMNSLEVFFENITFYTVVMIGILEHCLTNIVGIIVLWGSLLDVK